MKGIQIVRTSVRCESSWHEYYRAVADRNRELAETIPFPTMVQAFVTFACIGRAENNYVKLGEVQEIFIAPSFDRTLHVPVLVSLAYDTLVKGGVDMMSALEQASSSKGFVPIVEGWAQGGAEVFKAEVERSGLPATEWLTTYVGRAAKQVI